MTQTNRLTMQVDLVVHVSSRNDYDNAKGKI